MVPAALPVEELQDEGFPGPVIAAYGSPGDANRRVALPSLEWEAKKRKRRPRIIDTLTQARHFQHFVDTGQVGNAAQIARDHDLTRARVSLILSLLRLAPEILDYIDNLNGDEGQMFLTAKMPLPLVRMTRVE